MRCSTCRCVEDICTKSLRLSLRKYIGRQIQVGLVSGKNNFLVGKLLSISSGLATIRVKGITNYVTLCEIDYFKPRLR